MRENRSSQDRSLRNYRPQQGVSIYNTPISINDLRRLLRTLGIIVRIIMSVNNFHPKSDRLRHAVWRGQPASLDDALEESTLNRSQLTWYKEEIRSWTKVGKRGWNKKSIKRQNWQDLEPFMGVRKRMGKDQDDFQVCGLSIWRGNGAFIKM